MRSNFFIFALSVIAAFPLCWSLEAADRAKIDQYIDLAMSHFLGPATLGASSQKGFIYLIDAIEMAGSHFGFGDEFRDKIKKANALFKNTSVFNEEGVALLHAAYSRMNSGKKFEIPANISSIEDAREFCRKQLVSAKKSLKENNGQDSGKLLLEVALMIVTPMGGEDEA